METENKEEYIKCSGCKCQRHIVNDFEIYKGKRRKTCLSCKTNRAKQRKKYLCPHKKRKTYCVECGGGSICVHKKRKNQCVECGGGSICIHKKRKTQCKVCGDEVKITIRNWVSCSRTSDKKYNRYDANNFIDRCFLEGLIEDSEGKCHYCLTNIQYIIYGDTLASIERLDNSIGHIKSNCVIACLLCNKKHKD